MKKKLNSFLTPYTHSFYETLPDSREQGGYYPEKANFFLEMTGQRKKTILDVGCNDGFFGLQLQKVGHQVTGIDISDSMLQKAKKNGLNVKKVDIVRQPLPFANNSFDVVMLSDIIEHIFDTDQVLAECYRVLIPKGIILISTPNVASLGRRLMLLFGISPYLEFSSRLPTNGLPSVGHIRYYTKATLEQQLRIHNFDNIRTRGDVCVVGTMKIKFICSLFPSLCRQLLVVAQKI